MSFENNEYRSINLGDIVELVRWKQGLRLTAVSVLDGHIPIVLDASMNRQTMEIVSAREKVVIVGIEE